MYGPAGDFSESESRLVCHSTHRERRGERFSRLARGWNYGERLFDVSRTTVLPWVCWLFDVSFRTMVQKSLLSRRVDSRMVERLFLFPTKVFSFFFFLLYIKINRRIAGTDGFIRVGNCQATSMRRKSMYLRHRSIYSGLCFTAVVSSFSSSLCFRASFNGGLYLGKE